MSCWGPEHRSSEREHLQNVKRRLLPSAMVAKLLLYMDYSYLQQNNRLAYRFSRRRQLWCPKENSWSGIGGARFNSAFAFRHYGIIYCCIARYAKFSALKKNKYLLSLIGSRVQGLGHGLAEWCWLEGFHEVTVQLSARAAIIWRFNWVRAAASGTSHSLQGCW